MFSKLTATFLACCCAVAALAQLPSVASGTFRRFEAFASRYVSARNVDVWLPENYSAKNKYAVLYMHDGQMLFDSLVTWNRQSWDVDDALSALIKQRKVRNTIVVGIWNSGAGRHADYFPQKPFEALLAAHQQAVQQKLQQAGRTTAVFQPVSDNYLRFLVEELKPFVDSAFSTRKERSSTFVAGSSMGGLISLYAVCEYPSVFGGAACLSTHWPGVFDTVSNPVPTALFAYMKQRLPSPKTHRIYFDYGNKTLDALYPPLQAQADAVMKEKGYTKANWMTRFFPGEDHSENAWRKRLALPLLFLLRP